MGSAGAWRNAYPGFLREGREADAVPLLQHECGERCGQVAAVIELGIAGVATKGHAIACVQEDIYGDVGVLFELLDVELVAAAVDLPIEEAQLVAGLVLAVVAVLRAEAVEGTRVQAAEKALHCAARDELHVAEPAQDLGIQIFGGVGH